MWTKCLNTPEDVCLNYLLTFNVNTPHSIFPIALVNWKSNREYNSGRRKELKLLICWRSLRVDELKDLIYFQLILLNSFLPTQAIYRTGLLKTSILTSLYFLSCQRNMKITTDIAFFPYSDSPCYFPWAERGYRFIHTPVWRECPEWCCGHRADSVSYTHLHSLVRQLKLYSLISFSLI